MEKPQKNCPYCGEKILAVAKKCKHCGEWLTTTDNADKRTVAEPKTEKKKSNYKGLIITLAIICVALLIVLIINSRSNSYATSSSYDYDYYETEATEEAVEEPWVEAVPADAADDYYPY